MKHTPGPWQSKSEHEPLSIIGNIDGPDDGQYHYTPICEIEPSLFADENAANARLIAAAPDLLKALRAIAEMGDKTLIAPSLGEDCDRAHQLGANTAFAQAADIARDAINRVIHVARAAKMNIEPIYLDNGGMVYGVYEGILEVARFGSRIQAEQYVAGSATPCAPPSNP